MPGITLGVYAVDTLDKLHKGYLLSCIFMPTGVLIVEGWCKALPQVLKFIFRSNSDYIRNVSRALQKDFISLESKCHHELEAELCASVEPFRSATIKAITSLIKQLSFQTELNVLQAENKVVVFNLLEKRLEVVRKKNREFQEPNAIITEDLESLSKVEQKLIRKIEQLQGSGREFEAATREQRRLTSDVNDLTQQLHKLRKKMKVSERALLYGYAQDISHVLDNNEAQGNIELPTFKSPGPIKLNFEHSIIFDPENFLDRINELQKQKQLLTYYCQFHNSLLNLRKQQTTLQELSKPLSLDISEAETKENKDLVETEESHGSRTGLIAQSEEKDRQEKEIIASQLKKCQITRRLLEELLETITRSLNTVMHFQLDSGRLETLGASSSALTLTSRATVGLTPKLISEGKSREPSETSPSTFPLAAYSAAASAPSSIPTGSLSLSHQPLNLTQIRR